MSKMCEPIAALVQSLHHLDFTTIEQKVSDYHFSELYIKMKGKHNNEIDTINIPQIQRNNDSTFTCSCHWSTVELCYEEEETRANAKSDGTKQKT